MEILEQGKIWSIKEKCLGIGDGGGCMALLEVEAEDIYAIARLKDIDNPSFMASAYDYCYTFRCPCCNIESEVRNELPITIKRRALANLKKSIKTIRVDKYGRMYL